MAINRKTKNFLASFWTFVASMTVNFPAANRFRAIKCKTSKASDVTFWLFYSFILIYQPPAAKGPPRCHQIRCHPGPQGVIPDSDRLRSGIQSCSLYITSCYFRFILLKMKNYYVYILASMRNGIKIILLKDLLKNMLWTNLFIMS